jgi:hypothetical protein
MLIWYRKREQGVYKKQSKAANSIKQASQQKFSKNLHLNKWDGRC